MTVNIITKEDLQEFKEELLAELKTMIPVQETSSHRRWLRSYEVRKILNVSTGTLQTLRINGTLHPKKIGGIHFYDYQEICKVMENDSERKR